MGRKQRERKEKKLEELAAQREEVKAKSNTFDPRRFFMSPIFIVFAVCILALVAYPFVYAKYIPHGKYALLETSEGNIKIELRADKAPKTVANFIGLAKDGFYRNMIWHRVVKGFVIQTGDPTGTGTSGAGHQVDDEISDLNFAAGIVGMANAGANTNDSQFFITTADAQDSLNGKYTSFGQVVEGMDVVKKIEGYEVNDKEVPTVSVYLKDVVIK